MKGCMILREEKERFSAIYENRVDIEPIDLTFVFSKLRRLSEHFFCDSYLR